MQHVHLRKLVEADERAIAGRDRRRDPDLGLELADGHGIDQIRQGFPG
jgi:hypothetical protein